MTKKTISILPLLVILIVFTAASWLLAETFDNTSPARGHSALQDIDAVKNNFTALRAHEKSASTAPPANPVGDQLWWTTDTKKMYQRSNDNSTWILLWPEVGIGYGPAWYAWTSFDGSERNVKVHYAANITSGTAVHGIKQGSGNGFDADTVDTHHASDFSVAGHTHVGSDIIGGTVPDSDKIDGYHASIASVTSTVPVRNSSGVIIGTITTAQTASSVASGGVTSSAMATGAVTESAIASSAVSQGKLKTTQGEVSLSGATGTANLTLPGGEYGFYPRLKGDGGCTYSAQLANGLSGGSYQTSIFITCSCFPTSNHCYSTQRYVTASGTEYWLFILHNAAGDIKAAWGAPDHPCFGNGEDPAKVPHPFAAPAVGLQISLLDMASTNIIRSAAEQHGRGVIEELNSGGYALGEPVEFTPRDIDGHRMLYKADASYVVRSIVK
jgi:hypothetical protein